MTVVAVIAYHIRHNTKLAPFYQVVTMTVVTMVTTTVNLRKDNPPRSSRVYHRTFTQTTFPLETAYSRSHLLAVLIFTLTLKRCFWFFCEGWLCGYVCFVPSLLGVPVPRPDGNVSSGEKLLSANETPSTSRHTAWTSAAFNRSLCLSKNASGLRRRSMARPMRPRGEKSRGKSDRDP